MKFIVSGSIYGISGIPAVLMPMIMQWKGRKWSLILTCSFVFIGWLLSYTSTTITGILASESFHGLGTNSLFQVGFMGMTEMIDPKYRLFSMQLFGLCQTLGMAVCGIGGRFFHYKTISIMLVPAVVAILLALMWPESPPWLAYKGKLDKCEEAFTWLRGTDEKSATELTELIAAQKENYRVQNDRERFTLKKFWEQITSRDFYLPSLHTLLLLMMMYGSGADVVLIYFFEMVEKTTKNEKATLYSAIILYSIPICGVIVTKVLAKYVKNKTILFISTFGVICCLAGISIVTYMQTLGILAIESNLVLILLISFMICNGLGLDCFVFFMSSELMPVKHRNIGGAFLILCNCGLYALTLKISPYLMHYINMWGTFLLFTINGIVCLFLMCRYVPETKNRTLQEIEDFYAYGRFIERRIDKESIDVLDKTQNC